MPWLAWYGCGRVSWTPDARVRVSQWPHSHAATKAFPCLALEDADPCDYLEVTQTIFSWPMEQTQHHQILANGPPPLKYFGLLPTQPGGMPRKRRRGFRRDVGSSSSSSTKAAKTHAVPLFTSRKAHFRFPPRISFVFSVAVCRTTSKTRIFAASLHYRLF